MSISNLRGPRYTLNTNTGQLALSRPHLLLDAASLLLPRKEGVSTLSNELGQCGVWTSTPGSVQFQERMFRHTALVAVVVSGSLECATSTI
jgi:hypothetical protein